MEKEKAKQAVGDKGMNGRWREEDKYNKQKYRLGFCIVQKKSKETPNGIDVFLMTWCWMGETLRWQ